MAKSGKRAVRETHPRTVMKTVSWRFVATLTTMVIVYLFTGEFLLSIGVGAVEVIAKILFYYVQDLLGKAKHPLASIPVNRDLTPEDMQKVTQQLKDLGYIE